MIDKLTKLEGDLVEEIVNDVANRLHRRQDFQGVRWSPGIPQDDPYAELQVVDDEGEEYIIDIDVTLRPTGKRFT